MATSEKKSNLACPRCSFIGKSEQSLKVHIGRAHGRRRRRGGTGMAAAGRRGLICSICGKRIKTPAALKAHMTRMHPGMSERPVGEEALSPLQQQLTSFSLAELADLHEACRAEMKRRLGD